MKIFAKYKKFFQQDGQTAVFFALLLPVLILFLFVVFDLGWLYLNKSRLQNAAEAAAIAGANAFCIESATGYDTVTLIYEDNENYIKLRDEEKEFSDDFGDKVAVAKVSAKNAATASFNDNLGIGKDPENPEKDSWTKAQVEMPIAQVLGESANAEKIYYAVELTEDVKHIFKVLDNVFSTKIPAVAVVEISKFGERNLFNDALALDLTQTINNWEEQNSALKEINSNKYDKSEFNYYSYVEKRNRFYFDGNWNHFQDPDIKIHYVKGNTYKTEDIEVKIYGPSSKTSSANGNKIYSADEVDLFNIDFKQDVVLTFDGILTDDWDIDFDITDTGIKKVNVSEYRDNWGTNEINLRTHTTVNFVENYLTRELSEAAKNKVNKRYQNAGIGDGATSDPLYVRIESEPMVSNLYGRTNNQMNQLNSVRQLILNIDETNIYGSDDETIHKYKYRPLAIFYDGPEKNDATSARQSLPVIINLNEDFRGIIFMPNSPVVIIGNGHKFQGFVIAKEFRKLKTEDDYTKFTMKVDDNDTDVFIENVNEDTEPAFSDEYVFVSKDDKSFFKVPRNDLIYLTAEYVEQQHLSDLKNADDYLLTEYYRKKGDEARTEAYIRKNLKIGESTDPDVDIIEGTLTDWYEVKRDSDNITFSIRNRNSNFLFYKDGWRIAKDNNGNPKYIFQIKSLISNLSDYVEVKDSNGQSAYIKKTSLNGLPSYIKITSENNESRFILKDSRKFYYKKVVDKSPTLFVDYHGNVQYTDKLTSTTNLSGEWHLDARGKSPVFDPATFGLDENKNDTHYSRCGIVPKRRRYSALDAFETGGEYCQDMFFETERARYVL